MSALALGAVFNALPSLMTELEKVRGGPDER